MDMVDLLEPETVISGLKATSKKQALQALTARAADVTGLEERRILDVILEREKLGTTGVGHGVAIPHGKLKELDRVRGFFARLETPINFESLDDEPVDLIFLLLAPECAGADHLKALARVARLLREPDTCEKLRGSDSSDALFALLTDPLAVAA